MACRANFSATGDVVHSVSSFARVPVAADDHLIRGADLSLTSACSMNGLVSAGSALRPQAGQIAVGANRLWQVNCMFRI